MTRPRVRHRFEPATMTWAEASEYAFRKSESWLRDHIDELPGFPQPDHVIGLFSKRQIDQWLDQRFGSEPAAERDLEAELIARARNGTHMR